MNQPQINVTPLIDVLLVLLIIFMVVTPLKPSKIDTRIPSEPRPDRVAITDPRTLVVSLDRTGRLVINGDATSSTIDDPAAAIRRLREIFEKREQNMEFEKTVFIKASERTTYGSVARMIDALKQSGANPISLQIDQLER